MKLKLGDEILITGGKDKGRKGKIDKIYTKRGRVRVENLNVYKRHVRGFGGQKGGIIEFSRPLPLSNVALVCPRCAKPTRVSYRIDKQSLSANKKGEKTRVCAKCKKAIDIGKKEKN